ncbi:MAG: adenylyl-sulfate kinase [Pirellulales bacterium]|nr:adenylyl-sulfate kinase [Pirellulales bacterium]
MFDQADPLRNLVRTTVQAHPALRPGVPLVVLTGGPSVVGTSTVALQLTRELAQLGKRAVLVDADLVQTKLTRQLGVARSGCLADVLAGNRSAVEVLAPVCDQVCLLPGRWDPSAPPELHRLALQRFFSEVRNLHSRADVVVLDAGEGMSPWVQQMWQAAQQILMITSTDSKEVTETYAMIKLAPRDDVDGKLRLVVTGAEDRAGAERVGVNFAATCRQFLGVKIGPHVTLARSTAPDSANASTRRVSDDRAFTQSVRSLAADLMSHCLVLADSASQRADIRGAANLGGFVEK